MARVYIDQDRPESAQYHALMEKMGTVPLSELQEQLEDMVDEYPDYLDPYNTLYAIYQNQEDFKSADTILNRAYNRAHLLILDAKENWPDEMLWEEANNQHILRTVFNKALDFWMDDNRGDSLVALEALLKMNAKDEIGVRFYHLAVKNKFTYEAFMKRFLKDGVLDPSIEEWYKKEKGA